MTTDRVRIQDEEDTALKKQLEQVRWPLEHGDVTVKLRHGKVTLITVGRTIKAD